MQMEHISLNFVNMWVQVHDLPMGLMKEKVGTQLANYVGTFVEYDKNNNSSFWRQYMRIQVKIDVRMPLKKDARVKNKDGNWCTVKFKYEKLGIFCFVCGVMGHGENKCEIRFSMEHDDGTREWSTEIRADSRRQGGRITSRWLKEEGGGGVEQGGGARAGQSQAQGRNSYRGPTHADVAAEGFNNNHNSPESNQAALITRQAQSLVFNANQTPPAAHITQNINTISQTPIGNASPNQISAFTAFNSPNSTFLNGTIPSMSAVPSQMPNPFPNINSPIISPIILSQQKTDCIKPQSLSHQLLTFTGPPQQRDPQPSHQKLTRQPRVANKPGICNRPSLTTKPDPTQTRPRPEKKPKNLIPTNPAQHPSSSATVSEITEDMDSQSEKKRSREEDNSTDNKNSQTSEHFLTAGPGSQACRDQ
jgi:hypothetical protein